MKKKLEAELISIAHRILKMKNKSDIVALHQETQKLYEKLSVLRFVEESFGDVKPTIGSSEIETQFDEYFDKEQNVVSSENTPDTEENVPDGKEIPKSEPEIIDVPEEQPEISEDSPEEVDDSPEIENSDDSKMPEDQEETAVSSEDDSDENNDESEEIDESEENDDDAQDAAASDEDNEVDQAAEKSDEVTESDDSEESDDENDATEQSEEEADSEEKSTDEDDTDEQENSNQDEMPAEVPVTPEQPETAAELERAETLELEDSQIREEAVESNSDNENSQKKEEFFTPSFELAFDPKQDDKPEVAASPQFSFDDLLGKDYADPVFVKPEEERNDKPTANFNFEKFSSAPESKPVSLNDRLSKGITIGLNDRIAFIKHLFANSSEDYNRVLSQLMTFDTYDEARGFIDDMVKPDYNDWQGKDEYAERFMDIVEKRFS